MLFLPFPNCVGYSGGHRNVSDTVHPKSCLADRQAGRLSSRQADRQTSSQSGSQEIRHTERQAAETSPPGSGLLPDTWASVWREGQSWILTHPAQCQPLTDQLGLSLGLVYYSLKMFHYVITNKNMNKRLWGLSQLLLTALQRWDSFKKFSSCASRD